MVKPKPTLEAYKVKLLQNLEHINQQKQACIVREVELKAQLELIDGILTKLYPPKKVDDKTKP